MHSLPLRFALLLLITSWLAGCGEIRDYQYQELIHHRVTQGDTLYSIAFGYRLDYREIAGWNGIVAPYSIFVGQELIIIPPYDYIPSVSATPEPTPAVLSPSAAVATRVAPPKPPERVVTAPEPELAPKLGVVAAPPRASLPPATLPTLPPPLAPRSHQRERAGIHWGWPVKGAPKIKAAFAPNQQRKGIDIGGAEGSPILAVADGEVVYSGNGLLGYGNLIIIRHNDIYLSAYGYNRTLLARVGSTVRGGDQIAEMGGTHNKGSVLHFEIRRHGKPIDPIGYLPKRK